MAVYITEKAQKGRASFLFGYWHPINFNIWYKGDNKTLENVLDRFPYSSAVASFLRYQVNNDFILLDPRDLQTILGHGINKRRPPRKTVTEFDILELCGGCAKAEADFEKRIQSTLSAAGVSGVDKKSTLSAAGVSGVDKGSTLSAADVSVVNKEGFFDAWQRKFIDYFSSGSYPRKWDGRFTPDFVEKIRQSYTNTASYLKDIANEIRHEEGGKLDDEKAAEMAKDRIAKTISENAEDPKKVLKVWIETGYAV